MKKILLATLLLVALTSATFADGKNSAKLLSDLNTALKTVSESSWHTTELYKKAQFTLNNKSISAYVNTETNELIGFAIIIDANALPLGTAENIAKKYKAWQMVNQMLFIDASGNTSYFVQVNKKQNSLILKVSDKGKTSIYSKTQL